MSLVDEEASLAEMQGLLETDSEAKASTERGLTGTLEVVAALHTEGDLLITLALSFADAEAQIPQVLKATGEMQAHTATLTEDVAQHNKDQEAAKAAMAVARRCVRRRLPPSRRSLSAHAMHPRHAHLLSPPRARSPSSSSRSGARTGPSSPWMQQGPLQARALILSQQE